MPEPSITLGPTGVVAESSASLYTIFVYTTLPDGATSIIPFVTNSIAAVGAKPVTSFDTSLSPVKPTITSTESQPTATTDGDKSTPPSQGPPLSTLLPAILVPVVIVLILIPIIIFACLHYRNKRKNEPRRDSPDAYGPPQQTALLDNNQTSRSITLPSPFSDGERIQSGALGVYDIRKSLERSMEIGEPVPLYERHASQENDDAALEHVPSPTLPSPSKSPFYRPRSEEAWPLPSKANLPEPPAERGQPTKFHLLKPGASPATMHSAHAGHPNSSREALRPDSSTYDLTSASAGISDSPQLAGKAAQGDPFSRGRDSDLVSELSYHPSRGHSRSNSKKDNDAASIISAMTSRSRSGRRKSGRDADAVSFISAMSPEEPELPIQNFPFK